MCLTTITLEDNGIGRIAAKAQDSRIGHKSKGMQMIQTKIELYNLSILNSQITYQIEDLYSPTGEAKGTRIVLMIQTK